VTSPPSLRDLLPRCARREGQRPAVYSAAGVLDYRGLSARAAAAAKVIRNVGVPSQGQVALAVPNSVDYLAWFFGILRAGRVVVPLSPSIAPDERRACLEEGGVGWIVSLPGPSLRSAGTTSRPVEADSSARGDIVARQFSSGSTGRPRIILRTAANFSADAAHFASTLGIGRDDRFLGVAPFHHAYGGLSFLAAFPVGASVIALPRFLPGPVIEAARCYRPTVFLATPPMIAVLATCALAPGDEGAFRSLRHCVCSGAPLDTAAHDAFVDRFGVPVRVQYGSTETLAATIDLDGGFEEGRVGRPFDSVTVRVFDDDGRPLPPGVPGRVGISSEAACDGYANDPRGTAERFRDGFVFPGDRGIIDKTGVLHLLGRSDVINVGGLKVDPIEVAAAIRESLPVVAVEVCAGKRSGLPAVIALVEADPGRVTPSMVIAACRARLSAHKVPARVEVVERIARDENGKVIRGRLEAANSLVRSKAGRRPA
jgi:long-chain acyl-CoA synthetase